ncbi:MAG: ubiquinol-cytochrome c reductase iron-sulfur subunit [Ignavibacteriae bacterium]|nr:ubiquinol-cytochrome c reductase iron-sulfur subunit [Ignavibacteriota bacterium]
MSQTIDRRTFLRQLLVLGGVPSVALLHGCAVTGLTTYQVASTEGAIDLVISEYLELQYNGGAIQLDVESVSSPIVVVRTAHDTFVALSPICTHLGCTVRKERSFFRCPCHGSTYALDGTVVRGPAEHSLKTFYTENDGKTLVIHL